MTRINTIDPRLMTNVQLIAEYREAPRVINKVAAGKLYSNIPSSFRMGTGHESFFGDKLAYIHNRHQSILCELDNRKVKCPSRFKSDYVIDTTAMYKRCQVLFPELCQDWKPSQSDHIISMGRLIERQFLQTKQDYIVDTKIEKTQDGIWQSFISDVANRYGIAKACELIVKPFV